MGIDNFLTATFTHKRPTGTGAPSTIASNIACTPLDTTQSVPTQDYPIEKLFLLRETYTKYTAFLAGDFLVSGSNQYAIRAVHPWAAQGGIDDFYRLIVEVA